MHRILIILILIILPLAAWSADGCPFERLADSLLISADSATAPRIEMRWQADENVWLGAVCGIIPAKATDVYRVLRNYPAYTEFLPRFTQCVLLDAEAREMVRNGESLPPLSCMPVTCSKSMASQDTALLWTEITAIPVVGRIHSMVEMDADSAARTIYWRQIAGRFRIWEGTWRWKPCGERTIVLFATRFHLRTIIPGSVIHKAALRMLPRILKAVEGRVLQSINNSAAPVAADKSHLPADSGAPEP